MFLNRAPKHNDPCNENSNRRTMISQFQATHCMCETAWYTGTVTPGEDDFGLTWSGSGLFHVKCGAWRSVKTISCGDLWGNTCQVDVTWHGNRRDFESVGETSGWNPIGLPSSTSYSYIIKFTSLAFILQLLYIYIYIFMLGAVSCLFVRGAFFLSSWSSWLSWSRTSGPLGLPAPSPIF